MLYGSTFVVVLSTLLTLAMYASPFGHFQITRHGVRRGGVWGTPTGRISFHDGRVTELYSGHSVGEYFRDDRGWVWVSDTGTRYDLVTAGLLTKRCYHAETGQLVWTMFRVLPQGIDEP